MKLFIGIDVSSKDLQVAITDSENYQKPLLNQSFSNDLIGANEVKKIILQLAKQNSYDKVIIGMEATSIYSLSLIHISEPTRRHHVSRMPSSA